MHQRPPSKRHAAITVVCHYAPDLARQLRALHVVLRQTPDAAEVGGETAAPTPAPTAPAAVPERSNASPAGEALKDDQD
jgi:hypothetical protein